MKQISRRLLYQSIDRSETLRLAGGDTLSHLAAHQRMILGRIPDRKKPAPVYAD